MSSQLIESNVPEPALEPKVGVGIVILKHDAEKKKYVLMGRRRGAHSAGDWSFPGGHLVFGERFSAAILRELAEECGVTIGEPRFLCAGNVLAFLPERHYVEFAFAAEWVSGEPQNLEPDKCDGWVWVPLAGPFPEPISPFCVPLFKALDTGEPFFEC